MGESAFARALRTAETQREAGMADPRMIAERNAVPDELLERFWEKGLVLFGERVQQEYGLATPIFIDLRHKLYDDLTVLAALGQALHERLISIVADEPGSGSEATTGHRYS